jgi:hypothetical protein
VICHPNEQLDQEVADALDHAGLRVQRSRPISALRAPGRRRSAYRIDLQSGETIKARLVEDEETARRLFDLRRDLPCAFVPAFAQYRAVLLERWIPGDVVRDEHLSDALVVQAAALLANLHRTRIVLGVAVNEAGNTASWRKRSECDLLEIVSAGEFDSMQASTLLETLSHTDPGKAIFGLVHTDFCGENMVVDQGGRLHVVDNERLSIDSLGYDFARAWYRWALPEPLWASFRNAYATHAALAEPLETFDFWSIVSVVQSVFIRLRVDRDQARAPLDRLRRMATKFGGQRSNAG